MTMEDFYKYAVDGGFNMEVLGSPRSVGDRDNALVLSPDAWRAVGKVKGWDRKVCKYCGHPEIMAGELGYSECCNQWIRNEWVDQYYWNMLRMVKTLCDGKTIEEFIATL